MRAEQSEEAPQKTTRHKNQQPAEDEGGLLVFVRYQPRLRLATSQQPNTPNVLQASLLKVALMSGDHQAQF